MVDEEQVTRRVVTTPPPVAPYDTPYTTPYAAPVAGESVTTRRVTRSPGTAEMLRRLVVFVFGVVQALIVLRLVLLLIGASAANNIVQFIYTASSWFVDPFEGIVRTNAVQHGGSVLDVTAIVALVGLTILEMLIVAGLNILRRDT